MILPFGISGSTCLWYSDDPSCRNYGIQVFTELLMILPFRITGSTHIWNSDNPFYWNYMINSMILPFEIMGFRSLRSYQRSFLSKLRDQNICGTQTILPIGIMGSTHLWNSDNPSYWNYEINSMILPFEITGFRSLWSY